MGQKKKVPGKPTKTLDSVKDERFAHIIKNPVYRPVPKKEKKIEIDTRFQSMFKDERFKLKYKVDKRGRPVETTTDENLKRYYNLEDAEEEEDETRVDTKDSVEGEDSSSESGEDDKSDDVEEDEDVKEEDIKIKPKLKLDEATRKKLHSAEIDYARGEANFTDDSSSDDDSSTDEDEEETSLDHAWGELDKDAPRTEDATRRLALCNMDWDRVRSVDLMVLLGSFLPPGGIIKSVAIYPSEFGKERMAEEETQGPKELREDGGMKREALSDDEEDDEEQSGEDEDGEGSQYHREKLRQYQLNRLKYYYAVAEFDSTQTAEKVYAECDGIEYESSAAKIDLRFIPDEMDFDGDEPKDICKQVPDAAKYRPRFFTTTALQQVKVDLTWDETDPLRKELTEKIFDPKEKVEDDDIRAYLATSSESEEDEDEEDQIKEEDSDDENELKAKPKVSKQDAISKYKALLQSIETSESKKKEKDMEMEITWGVGLKDKTEQLVKKKLEEKEKSNRTPWEEMLDKRKEKRIARKHERKRKNSDSDDSDSDKDEGDQFFSDDDVDVDMTDEFFQSEMRTNEVFKNAKPKKKEGKKNKDKPEKEEKNGKTDAELELLLMDEDDTKRHFSLKKIIEEETASKSKKKWKSKKKKAKLGQESATPKDDFEINVDDQRFAGLFNSHHFNVDPSDPNFKKTKAMDRIITEKQKRRAQGKEREVEMPKAESSKEDVGRSDKIAPKISEKVHKKAELSYLVKSIKRNTENLKSKKKTNFRPKSKF